MGKLRAVALGAIIDGRQGQREMATPLSFARLSGLPFGHCHLLSYPFLRGQPRKHGKTGVNSAGRATTRTQIEVLTTGGA